ncbi:MAG: multicopper oxidase domain-containing protein [Nitrososphaerota archaeon]|nr:multicopper oxidase domain-containing protein [Nitrososphaerota archaeon]
MTKREKAVHLGAGWSGRRTIRRPGASAARTAVLAVAIVAALAAGGVLAYWAGYFSPPPSQGGPSLMQATCASVSNSTGSVQHVASGGSGGHAYFLIVEGDPPSPYAGMNGSWIGFTQNATAPWPVITVKAGQLVSFHVINCASSEIHGFQITHYDDISKNLISIQPGDSYNVTFTATQAGTFRIYCGIFCNIHPGMQNGELVVT